MGGDRVHRHAASASSHADSSRSREIDAKLVHLKITPDARLTNERVEQLAQTLCVYQSPLERWNGKGFSKESLVSFETVLEKENTSFILTLDESTKSLAKKAIETTWPRVSIEEVADPFDIKPTCISSLSLNYHYMFAIRVDRREISLLSSILETLNMLEEDEKVYIQTLAIPAEKDWYNGAVEAYERFKQGQMPQKFRFTKQEFIKTGVKAAAHVALGVASVTSELITGEELEKIDLNVSERAQILRDGSLRRETLQKTKADAYAVSIRVGVVASTERAKAIVRMITMAFRELDGDNYLVANDVKVDKVWKKIKERKSSIRVQKDYMSIPEASRLMMLPTHSLQEKYKLESIQTLEHEISKNLLKGGIKIGECSLRGSQYPVYQPTDNWDELCLPNIVIGGMGQGKTRGFGANWIVESVRNGFGALAIDPAKGEMGDEVEAALPADKVIRIRLGKTLISLDWCETKHSSRSKNRLANIIISFFDTAADETGAQTSRFIRAIVTGMQGNKMSEIIRIMEDEKYRKECVAKMPDGLHKSTLNDLSAMTENKRMQVLSPIYNRLDTILGDEYLSECMESERSIDMVDLMSQRKAIIIDVPKKELGPEGVNLIVNLLSTKIDLAMTLRKEENQFPFFVVFDEPHQFLRSARTWKSAAVESRKWRVGYVWMFHSWEQIPRDLAEIIKSAGVHYHIYPSSKRTFIDLAEEIRPFTLEDGLKLKRYHAINLIRTGGETAKPFIAHMAPPPSKNKAS